jgi:hypothetical protein
MVRGACMHARIACARICMMTLMTASDGQSIYPRGSHCMEHCVRSAYAPTAILGSPAAIPRSSPPRIRWFVHGAEIIYLIFFVTKFGSLREYVLYLWRKSRNDREPHRRGVGERWSAG